MNKQKVFNIIQIGNKEDVVSRFFDIFIASVIILNILPDEDSLQVMNQIIKEKRNILC